MELAYAILGPNEKEVDMQHGFLTMLVDDLLILIKLLLGRERCKCAHQ